MYIIDYVLKLYITNCLTRTVINMKMYNYYEPLIWKIICTNEYSSINKRNKKKNTGGRHNEEHKHHAPVYLGVWMCEGVGAQVICRI